MDYEKKDFRKLYEDLVKSDWFKKAYHDKSLGDCPFDIPELAESEDERIRKEIVKYVTENKSIAPIGSPNHFDEMLAWLEKQKEQKPADKAKDFFDSAESYGDKEFPRLAKVKATGKIVNIINGTLSIEGKRWRAYSSDKDDGYKLYRPDELFFLDTEHESEERFKEAREKYQVEWSEEDEKMLTDISWAIRHCAYDDKKKERVMKWFNDDYRKFRRPQPKVELTELDKNILEAAIAFVEQNDHFNYWGGVNKHTVLSALRSLKPHWKPSEEQMEALRVTIDFMPDTFKPRCTLITLQNGLEKLI